MAFAGHVTSNTRVRLVLLVSASVFVAYFCASQLSTREAGERVATAQGALDEASEAADLRAQIAALSQEIGDLHAHFARLVGDADPATAMQGAAGDLRYANVTMTERAPLTDDETSLLNGTATRNGARFYGFDPVRYDGRPIYPARGTCYSHGEVERLEAYQRAAAQPSVVLVLGGGGPLGRALVAAMEAIGKYVLNVSSKLMLDLRYAKEEALAYYLGDIRIELAFILAWDYRQSDAENAGMVGTIARYLDSRRVPFVFFSTAYAQSKGLLFGLSKAAAEAHVFSVGGGHVLRLPDVFGVEDTHVGNSHLHYIGAVLNKCVRGDMAPVAADFKIDLLGAPRAALFARDVADAIVRAAFAGEGNTFVALPILSTVAPPLTNWTTAAGVATAINDAWREFKSAEHPAGDVSECVPHDEIELLMDPVAWAGSSAARPKPEGVLLRVTLSSTLRAHFADLLRHYRDRRANWSAVAEQRPYVSVITGVRADDYAGSIMERVQVAIDVLAHYCDRYMVSYELLLVEWNPLPNRRAARALVIPPSMRGRARFITVPASIHVSLGCKAKMLDMWAKNVGMRRARGEYLLNFIPDSLWDESIYEALALRRLSPDTLYVGSRFQADAALPADVRLRGPDAVLGWVRDRALRNAEDKALRDKQYAVYGRSRPASQLCEATINAPGDFALAHRDAIANKIRGYVETCDVRHVDALFVYQAFHKGLAVSHIGDIYHQHHPVMQSLYFPIDGKLMVRLREGACCAGVVHMQLTRLLVADGDWGFREAKFVESDANAH